MVETSVYFSNVFLTLTYPIRKIEFLIYLVDEVKHLCEEQESSKDPDSFLCVSNCLNSQLYSSGDLSIIGQGSIHSMIHADGELLVKGIVRGGELYARKGMSVQEVGSESGTKTKLIVPA